MTPLNRKRFVAAVVLVTLVKAFLLLWTAHPFDFWSFVHTFQRDSTYGLNVFDGWNKGNFLIVLWYPLYAVYTAVLSLLHLQADNLLLLHFFFKVPFLVIDLLCGYLLMVGVARHTGSGSKGRLAFWLWFLNPIIFYVYGIHGHYELLTPFSLILILYGLRFEKPLPLAAGLVISFTTKYFILFAVPFLVFYLLRNRRHKLFFVAAALFVAGVVVSYLQFAYNPALIHQAVSSIFDLSSHGGVVASKVTVPPLNLFSAINYLAHPSYPLDSWNNPLLFSIANLNIKLSALILLAHLGYRGWSVFGRKREYGFGTLVIDLFAFFSYFLMLLTNFQPHYLCWLVPFFILLIVEEVGFTVPFLLYTVAGFVYCFKNEQGTQTFFLDLTHDASRALSLDATDPRTMYGLAFCVIVAMLVALFMAVRFRRLAGDASRYLRWLAVAGVLCWIFLLIPYARIIPTLHPRGLPHDLAFTYFGHTYKGYAFANYPVQETSGSTAVFSEDNQFGTFMTQEIMAMPKEAQSNFRASILLTGPDTDYLKQVMADVTYNACPLSLASDEITSLSDGKQYPALSLPVGCLSSGTSQLKGLDGSVGKSDLQLYVETQPTTQQVSPLRQSLMRWLTVVGVAYCLAMLVAGLWLVRRIGSLGEDRGAA